MNKTAVWIIGLVVVAAVMFGVGYLVATQVSGSSSDQGGLVVSGGSGGPGGAFAQLTEEERQQLQNMTPSEREKFFADKGIQMPQGLDTAGGPGGGGGFRGRGSMEASGTVQSVSADKITVSLNNGGSATFYVDDTTVKAAVAGAKPDVVAGDKVLIYAEPEAEGVTAATVIIVQ